MVMEEITPEESSAPYMVDTTWFEENGFSFDDFVQSRMCDSCQARVDDEVEERYTVLDKKTGRAVAESNQVSNGGGYYQLRLNLADRYFEIRSHNERIRIQATFGRTAQTAQVD